MRWNRTAADNRVSDPGGRVGVQHGKGLCLDLHPVSRLNRVRAHNQLQVLGLTIDYLIALATGSAGRLGGVPIGLRPVDRAHSFLDPGARQVSRRDGRRFT